MPQDSLPVGIDDCQLDIVASRAGLYQFPDNFQLVSGVFWIRCGVPDQFRQQLTIKIEHCSKISSSTNLSFVRAHCSQEILPYKFKAVKGHGSFSPDSSYGSLEVTHFSSYAVVGEDVERCYTARAYCLEKSFSVMTFHVAISWNVKTHYKVTICVYVYIS